MRKIGLLLVANVVLFLFLVTTRPTPAIGANTSSMCGVDIHCCCMKSVSSGSFCCVDCEDECELSAEKQCTKETDC